MGYLILRIVNSAYSVFTMLILARCVISWFPGIKLYKEPVKSIVKIADLILDPIRDFLLKRGLITFIDISPIIAILLMRMVVQIINYILM